MDIDALPPGETALIDANIFICHLSNSSAQRSRFLRRVVLGEVGGCVTTVIVAEVLHRRMVAEALTKGLIPAGQLLKKLNSTAFRSPQCGIRWMSERRRPQIISSSLEE